MRAVARVAAYALATGLTSAPLPELLGAQESFLGPQTACELKQPNSKINNAIQALVTAVAKPDQPGSRRRFGRRLLRPRGPPPRRRRGLAERPAGGLEQRLAPGGGQGAGPSSCAAGRAAAREPRFHPARDHQRLHRAGAPHGLVPIA